MFYSRRARRILPALLAVTVSASLAGLVLLSSEELKRLGVSAASSLVGLSNLRFWHAIDYFAPDARLDPFLMTWSLGVEEQFYLFLPPLFLLLRRLSARMILLAVSALTLGSFVLAVALSARFPAADFYLLPSRAWELGVGVLLAVWTQTSTVRLPERFKTLTSVAGLAAVVTSVFAFDALTPFPGFAAALPTLGAAALLASEGASPNRLILSNPVMSSIGRVSYSWYLWHWPMMAFVRVCCVGEPPLAALLATAGLSLGLAYLSYLLVETPFRRRRWPNPRIIAVYGGAVGAGLVLTLGLVAGHGWPQRLSPTARQIEAVMAASGSGPCLANWGVAAPNLSSACLAIPARASAIAIIGDSHAGALGPGVRSLATKSGLGFVILAKSSCRPLLGVSVWMNEQPSLQADCASFMLSAFQDLARNPNVKVVIIAGHWAGALADPRKEHYIAVDPALGSSDGPALLAQGLKRSAAYLRQAGKSVVLIGDTPQWLFDPFRAALIHAIPARALLGRAVAGPIPLSPAPLSSVDASTQRLNALVEDAARSTGARYLNGWSAFCSRRGCDFEEDQAPLFIDQSHLSALGATRALASFGPAAPPASESRP